MRFEIIIIASGDAPGTEGTEGTLEEPGAEPSASMHASETEPSTLPEPNAEPLTEVELGVELENMLE